MNRRKTGELRMLATDTVLQESTFQSAGHRSAQGTDLEFQDLLTRARRGESEPLGRLLQWYGNYLNILASAQLDRRIRRRVNPSDVVQEAMLAAHRDFADFRGDSKGELLGWLRMILIHTLHRTFDRHINVAKRDVRREVSIDDACHRITDSIDSLAIVIPTDSESPSAQMNTRERAIELANQLRQLRPMYREVIILRVLQGLGFAAIGEQMQRSEGAVRMLFLRALEAIKTQEGNNNGHAS